MGYRDIPDLYTADEQDFLAQIEQRIPGATTGFDTYASIGADMRLVLAGYHTATLPRTGYLRVGIPAKRVQSVNAHLASTVKIGLYLNSYAEEPVDGHNLFDMLLSHDVQERVCNDYTPFDPVTREEKLKLEELAWRLLIHGSSMPDNCQKVYRLYQEFEENKTPTAIIANDSDKLCMVLETSVLRNEFPEAEEKLLQFWEYSEPRLKTPMAKQLYKEVAEMFPKIHPLKRVIDAPRPSFVERLRRQGFPIS